MNECGKKWSLPLSIEFPWFSGITEFFGDMFQIPFCPSSHDLLGDGYTKVNPIRGADFSGSPSLEGFFSKCTPTKDHYL